jgi:uncharacterized coiled-coil DUF342 family protein
MTASADDPAPRDEPVTDETQTPEPNLTEEFREFGRQLTTLLHTLRDSPRTKEIEQQVTHAMREMERQVNEALAAARQKAQTQEWKETIRGAAATAADETQRGLARGLHALNEHMAKAAQEAENSRSKTTGESGPGQGGG